jgi:hypothetical protein
MPVFAEMVLSNELVIREVLSKILVEVAHTVAKMVPAKTRCSSGGD